MDAPNELLDVSFLGLRRKQEIAWSRYVFLKIFPSLSPLPCFCPFLGKIGYSVDGFTKIERTGLTCILFTGSNSPMWKLLCAGSMGA